MKRIVLNVARADLAYSKKASPTKMYACMIYDKHDNVVTTKDVSKKNDLKLEDFLSIDLIFFDKNKNSSYGFIFKPVTALWIM